MYVGGPENCQEGEDPNILPQEEEGETPGNPNTGRIPLAAERVSGFRGNTG